MSKTSFFSPAVFSKNIKRFWPIWVSYFVIWLIAMPVNILIKPSLFMSAEQLTRSTASDVVSLAASLGLWLSFFYAALCAMAVFSYLYTAKSAGMLHALPISRVSLFLTNLASGLVFLLAPNLLIFGLSILAEASTGALYMPVLWQWLYLTCATGIFFMIFAAFCAQFTGNLLALPAFYVILNLLAVFFELMVQGLGSILLFGYDGSGNYGLSWLSPIFYMAQTIGSASSYNNEVLTLSEIWVYGTSSLVWYALAAVVLGALALLIYRRRKVECAGDVVSVPQLRPVFRWGMAVCVGVLLSLLCLDIFSVYETSRTYPVLLVLMLLWGFVGWFVADMLLKKTFRVFKTGWKGFAVFAILVAALLTCAEFDVFGVEKRVPQADDIDYVLVGNTIFDDPETFSEITALHRDIVADKKDLEQTSRAFDDQMYNYSYDPDDYAYEHNLNIRYHLKNGNTVYRSYGIPVTKEARADQNSLASRLDTLLNSSVQRQNRQDAVSLKEGSVIAATVDFPTDYSWDEVTVNGNDAQALADAILKDIEAGGAEEAEIFPTEEYYQDYQNTIYFTLLSSEEDVLKAEALDSYTVSITITTGCKNLIRALNDLGLLTGQHQLALQ